MKITDVNIHVVRPDAGPPGPSGSITGWVFVEIETDEGISGVAPPPSMPSAVSRPQLALPMFAFRDRRATRGATATALLVVDKGRT